jgi:hypothetical protein
MISGVIWRWLFQQIRKTRSGSHGTQGVPWDGAFWTHGGPRGPVDQSYRGKIFHYHLKIHLVNPKYISNHKTQWQTNLRSTKLIKVKNLLVDHFLSSASSTVLNMPFWPWDPPDLRRTSAAPSPVRQDRNGMKQTDANGCSQSTPKLGWSCNMCFN